MKTKLIIGTFLYCIFIVTAQAQDLYVDVKAKFKVTAEYEEFNWTVVKKDGWKIRKDEDQRLVFLMEARVPVSKLPFKKYVGPSFFSIDKAGLVTVGISIGDSDSGSTSELQLPTERKKILEFARPLILKNQGGDYASGTWSFTGELEIKVSKD